MTFSFRCPNCDVKMRGSDNNVGKKVKCPSCQQPFTVPAPPAASRKRTSKKASAGTDPPTSATPTEDDFLAGLVSDGDAINTESQRRPKRRRRPSSSGSPSQSTNKDYFRNTRQSATLKRKDLRERVMKGFSGPIDRVRTTALYRIGIILTAGFVVLLPILYVALIGLAGYGVYWHATENIGIASSGRGRLRIVAILIYLGPIIAGGISVLFMLKPLFARTVRYGGHVSLNPGAQPLLFEFVERICDTVHAPRPSRIDVNFDINASAGFAGGLGSLFTSRLVLTIGLPAGRWPFPAATGWNSGT